MIKDVLVTIPPRDVPSPALDYAVTLAKTFDAHLTGVAFVQDAAFAGALFDWAPAIVLEEYRREMEAAAEVAKIRFEETCQREGLSAEPIVLSAGAVSLPERLAYAARRFDLTILPQANDEDERSGDAMIEAALLGSGRPVLIVPCFQDGEVKFDRILVCWDGSRNAARAIADAMPFLTRARRVEVVTVAANGKRDDGIAGSHIAHHLSRHDVIVEVGNIVANGQDVSRRIRSHAAQQSADLIVMGGYGHSRLREFILGGVTRDMLSSANVPTLMSH
ncbi:universal stress protein [Bradyrhizobium sp. CB1717]|uniref:universal stress protein n=1 Tax=Bradyrhizobium sp. CB1717 TaxID=3039154 RepID=UPI0024B0D7D1|nr:universal stress protein [Bradyrhizobium sp. CB1717]WFU23672.1 universal stress protein [Bradyrhizobium sp. CB1717]